MDITIQSILLANLNVILSGAPGTGKTYTARKVAKAMVGAEVPEDATDEEKKAAETAEEERIASIQFHPGYDYSDFVVGMKPVLISADMGKEVSFQWQDGIFKKFADKARKAYNDAPDKANAPKFVFLIDEINRADLSHVFGELFSLLEKDCRYPNNAKGITLPNGETFDIPENLYIIGTMNEIDPGGKRVDFAFRRRFAWFEMSPESQAGMLDENLGGMAEEAKRRMDRLNKAICGNHALGKDYQIGPAYFLKAKDYGERPWDALWKYHFEGLLRDYLRWTVFDAELAQVALDQLHAAYDPSWKARGKKVCKTDDNNCEPSDDGCEI